MTRDNAQKDATVAQHSRQADEFARAYEGDDPYASCFAYSRARLGSWLDRLVPADGRGLRALDVGCGTGHHVAWLRARGFEVVGVDGSEAMLEKARAANPGTTFHRCDVERLPLPGASFDLVLCVEVLRYLPTPHKALGELARVARTGGLVLATAAPLLSLNGYVIVNRLAPILPIRSLVRLRQFFTTSSRLKQAALSTGLEEAVVHGVYGGPVNWIERLTPRLLAGFLRTMRPVDEALADRGPLRELSNMFLLVARKASP
jgi:ubiquinone/menaquinone biosynthesis C-methylase UbiE